MAMAEMFASVVGDDYTTLIHHFSKKMWSCSKCGWCKGNVKEAALLRVEGMLFHHKARLWCWSCSQRHKARLFAP